MKKKILSICMAVMMAATVLTGCGGADNSADNSTNNSAQNVYVISREEGSGTRGAFVELMGIEQKNEAGEKVDMTIDTAEVTNSTSVMITTVQGNEAGIGYISLGSMDDTKVKAIKVDGVEATVENVKNGTYKVARPFNIATMAEVSDAAQDFVNFILSTEGQAIVEEKGYIKLDNTASFVSNGATGKIVVGGSSSVSPVMEKLIEGYATINAGVEVELQTSDSSTGMSATADGTLDIGMASRALKDSEIEKGLVGTQIAMDGIAVIVNKENTAVDNLTSEQIMKIYTGEIKNWSEIQ
ncbi:MAG: substrate-binding domain-containing protein [Lachnospiraceae bacterium]|nr:substrate-binding domain-containing protein [Lachnospiraceae bacterium]